MSSNNSFIAAVRRVFIGATGHLRIVWQIILTLLLWHSLSFTSAYLLSRLMLRMFDNWGINSANISLAPGWVQLLAVYQSHLTGAASALIASVLAFIAMRRYGSISLKPTVQSLKSAAFGAVTGIIIPLLFMGIFLMCDSMRLTTPVPRFSIHIPLMFPFCMITAAAETLIAFGYVRTASTHQAGRIPGIILSAIVFSLMNILGFGTVLSAINALLIGITLALVAESFGLAGCAALRFGWLWTISSIAGFPESSHGLFTMYPVSENLITGGYHGPEAGLAVTVICFAICLFCLIIPAIQKLKRHEKSPDGQ